MVFRRSLIITLIICVGLPPANDSALWAESAPPASPVRSKQVANLLGEGAQVKLRLTDGRKLKGVVESTDDSGIVLDPKGEGTSQPFAYEEISELKPAKRSYKASGPIDPLEARRAVVGLGVGQHIMVKVNNQKLRGHIQAIEKDAFTLLPDRQTSPVEVAYSDVQAVNKNLSAGATFAVVVGIVAAAALMAVWLTGSDSVRESL
jgi:ribosome maturation factor RimP